MNIIDRHNVVDEIDKVVKSIRLSFNKLSFDLESLNKLLKFYFENTNINK